MEHRLSQNKSELTSSPITSSTETVGNVKIRGRRSNKRLDVYTTDGWKTIQTLRDSPRSSSDLRDIGKPIIDKIFNLYKNSSITTSDGHDIFISRTGLKHIGNGPGNCHLLYRYYLVKSITQVKEIIERAALLNKEPHKSGDPSCHVLIFLSTYITDEGYSINVRITVKEDIHTGKKYYDHYFIME